MKKIVIIDGNDGTGKTTLATKLADTLSGIYVKPFQVADPLLIWLHKSNKYDEFTQVAKLCLTKAIDDNMDESVIVMDRGWPTALSVTDLSFEEQYEIHEKTIVLTASTSEIINRHNSRGEVISLDYLTRFNENVKKVIDKFNLDVIDTTNKNLDSTLEAALRIITNE
ncbi:putative Thymidylate kinase [Vibrio crassostreae]|nr:putative Thymidylate kinase [Vibrio crassostreae]CAK3797867.1 putative Thymidylate kinase [Vibrio crassostreae]